MDMRVLLVGQNENLPMLGEFLQRRDCQVEATPDGPQVVAIVQYQLQQGRPYDIVIVDYDTSGTEPFALVQGLKQVDPDIAIALMVEFMHKAQIKPYADQAGASFVFDKPLDLSQVERFVQNQSHFRKSGLSGTQTKIHSTSHHRRSLRKQTGTQSEEYRSATYHRSGSEQALTPSKSQNQGESQDGPFFGTSRIGEGSGTNRTISDPDMQPGTGSAYNRQKSSVSNIKGSGQTSRIRRSVTGTFRQGTPPPGTVPPPTGNSAEAGPAITAHYTNSFPAPGTQPQQQTTPQEGESTKRVRCAHCQQVFQVICKDKAYTMPCIHCGGLNKIMP